MSRHTASDCTSISRRNFLKITMGAITLLPTVGSASMLSSREALAAEGSARPALATGAEVYVVRTNELSVVVTDVSQPAHTANLVPGATVRVTSRYNGKIVEGTTDEYGEVHFDITELAEDEGKAEKPAVFAFNATIEVVASGYRTFRTGLYRVEGGVAMGVPTQPREKDMPYPLCVSLDDWDMLYTVGEGSEFVCCAGNDEAHTFALELDNCSPGAAVQAGLFASGTELAHATVTADDAGKATVKFTDTFLQSGTAAALPTGDDRPFTMRYATSGTTYEVPITLQVDAAPQDAQDQQVKKDLTLTPFNDESMFLGLTVPEGFPIIGGDKFKLWEPNWPVTVAFDPFGFLRVKASTPDWGYVRDNGNKDPHGWKTHPRKTGRKQYENLLESADAAVSNTFEALTDKKGTFKQIGFTRKLTFAVALDLIGAAIWSFEGKDTRGRAALQLRAGLNYSIAEMFWLGPFPVAIRFTCGINLNAAGQAGIVTPSVWKFSEYRWDFTSIGFDLQICLPFSLAAGVGVPGAASVSVKGSFSITFYLHAGPIPKGFENRPKVHLRLAAVCSVTVELELLLFTQSHTLWKSDWPDWYNNWDNVAIRQGESLSAPQLEGNLASAFSNPRIIDSQALAAVAEFITAGFAGQASEEQLARYTLNVQDANGETVSQQLYLSDKEASELTQALNATTQTTAAAGTASTTAGAKAVGVSEVASDGELGLGIETTSEPALDTMGAMGTESLDTADTNDSKTLAAETAALTLTATDDKTSRWSTALPQAVPTGRCEYVTAPVAQRPGVLELGRETGIKPATDIRIASNILSASRSKVYSIGGSDWVCRIGVVLVGDKPRTRVIAEAVGTSERRVLDFYTGLDHDQYLDYDFDLCTFQTGGQTVVSMVVISGLRERGDVTSLSVAAASTVVSYVCCRDWNAGGGFVGTSVSAEQVDACGIGALGLDPATFSHHFSCPQIRHIADGGAGQCVVSYLERASATPDGLLSSEYGTVLVGVGMLFFNDNTQTPVITDMDRVRLTVTSIADGSVTEASLTERINGWHVLTLKGGAGTHHVFVRTDACASTAPNGMALPRIQELVNLDAGAYGSLIDRLVAVPGQDRFFTCIDGKLKEVRVVVSGGVPALEIEGFGDEELSITDFGVCSSGDVLYWPASRDGHSTYKFTEEDDAKLDDDDDLHTIVGARIRSGKMCRPFVIGEVGHPMHRIRSLSDTGDHLSFVSSATVDAAEGKGEEWYTAIPWVRCATILNASPTTHVLSRGDRLPFLVMIRNDGNCFISGVTLDVREKDGGSIGTIDLVFAEDNTLESEWNMRAEDGSLQGVEDDYALAPGMTSLYYAEDVTIPESWAGTKELEITIAGVHGVAVEGIVSQAEDVSIEYLPGQAAATSLNVQGASLASEAYGEFDRADIRVVGTSAGGAGTGGASAGGTGTGTSAGGTAAAGGSSSAGGSGGTSGTAGSSTRTATPGTGDASPSGTLASLLALGGAAALAAYGARRKRHE